MNGWNPGMLDGVNNIVMIVIQDGLWAMDEVDCGRESRRNEKERVTGLAVLIL